ncbi:MAG: glycine betaine/L-proline ABC transporter substrate-binding protein ProX [Acidimicrobiia bacterium]|nr:glycine betaine/L-proline ABC transporter substrate-binding protein ProX [Acidimicrobiia bacterium]
MKKQQRNAVVLVGALAALVVVTLVVIFSGEEEDQTVSMARATWSSGYMQAEVYAQLIGELGYTVTDPAAHTLDPYSFYPALDSGQYDLWANGWFPTHDIYLTAETAAGLEYDRSIEAVGYQVESGALQGYMIDKATADSMGIASMSQLADASVAAVFDQDGDGLADLIGCNEGWGCQTIIDNHIAELGWGSNVEQVSAAYGELMQGVQDRVAAGDPVLFYAWTPNWTYEALAPGVDAVWLESPALEDDEGTTEVRGLAGCASNPCNLGWPVNSIRAVGNSEFLDNNADIRRLLEQVQIPLADIAAQNAKANPNAKADAAAWIADNRALVDIWLTNARG